MSPGNVFVELAVAQAAVQDPDQPVGEGRAGPGDCLPHTSLGEGPRPAGVGEVAVPGVASEDDLRFAGGSHDGVMCGRSSCEAGSGLSTSGSPPAPENRPRRATRPDRRRSVSIATVIPLGPRRARRSTCGAAASLEGPGQAAAAGRAPGSSLDADVVMGLSPGVTNEHPCHRHLPHLPVVIGSLSRGDQ